MKNAQRWLLPALFAGCMLLTESHSVPAYGKSHDRHHAKQKHHSSTPFAYIGAADAAHGRPHHQRPAERSPQTVHPLKTAHPSKTPHLPTAKHKSHPLNWIPPK